jgi:CRP-like cAMP-binding protein
MTTVTLLVVPAAVLDELAATDAGLRRALHEHFASLRAEDHAGRRLALFGTARQRLAAFLLDAVERWGAPVARGVRVDVPLAQPEVAAAIGATRKMVGITLRAFERDGVLARTGQKILVLDHDKLAAAGHPRQVSAIPSDALRARAAASPRARRKVTGA